MLELTTMDFSIRGVRITPGQKALTFTPSPARWRVRLEELVRRNASTPRDAALQQSYLFEQYARTLHALAQKHPLLLQLG